MTKHKKIFIIVMTILCLFLIVFTLNPSGFSKTLRSAVGIIINPVSGAVSGAVYWAGDRIGFISQMNSLHDRVRELEDENSRLTIENTRLQEAKEEIEKLSELLRIKNEYADYPTVGAKIIGKEPVDSYDAYKINKGENDGLKVNMVALAPGGLMGMVRECNTFDSVVVSLIDDRSSIAAMCSRTNDKGFVKGDSELMRQGLCLMEYIDIDAQILPGDEILTSPLSAYYPPGIIIGRVKEVALDNNRLTKHAIIEPSVSLSHLETILIITQEFNTTASG
ncbi:MAG: rod shape-determining protein MreC [Clostridiales bacterium]|nr:rod shape-determining protein MreC [Clostridiales bacterium]